MCTACYKPGNVKLRPDILDQGSKSGVGRSWACPTAPNRSTSSSTAVSGSLKSEIEEALRYGVVKMNVDTDAQ